MATLKNSFCSPCFRLTQELKEIPHFARPLILSYEDKGMTTKSQDFFALKLSTFNAAKRARPRDMNF